MNVVILGAGYGGLACALRLARRARRRAQITLVNASDRFVDRIRLHQQAAGRPAPERSLVRMLAGTGVTPCIGTAERVDLGARRVHVGGEALDWDHLVLALGSRIATASVPGADRHADTLDAGRAARVAPRLETLATRGGRVLVGGGGLTGIEGATEIAEAFPGLAVTLVSHGRVAGGWSAAARAHLLRTFARLRIELREDVRVNALAADHAETDAGPIAFDACLWAAGFVAATLPRQAGLPVNARGQMLVDDCLRSLADPRVHGVGDNAALAQPEGEPLPLGCKTALPMGAHVGDNLARIARGQDPRPFRFAAPLFCVSLGRRDGLVQTAAGGGALTGRVLTGRLGAWVKELISRGVLWALRLERAGIPGVFWAHGPATRAAGAAVAPR